MIRYSVGKALVWIGVAFMWLGFIVADGMASALCTMERVGHGMRGDR